MKKAVFCRWQSVCKHTVKIPCVIGNYLLAFSKYLIDWWFEVNMVYFLVWDIMSAVHLRALQWQISRVGMCSVNDLLRRTYVAQYYRKWATWEKKHSVDLTHWGSF